MRRKSSEPFLYVKYNNCTCFTPFFCAKKVEEIYEIMEAVTQFFASIFKKAEVNNDLVKKLK